MTGSLSPSMDIREKGVREAITGMVVIREKIMRLRAVAPLIVIQT